MNFYQISIPLFDSFQRLSLVTMNTSEHKETIKRIALQLSENKKKSFFLVQINLTSN